MNHLYDRALRAAYRSRTDLDQFTKLGHNQSAKAAYLAARPSSYFLFFVVVLLRLRLRVVVARPTTVGLPNLASAPGILARLSLDMLLLLLLVRQHLLLLCRCLGGFLCCFTRYWMNSHSIVSLCKVVKRHADESRTHT